MKVVKQVYIYFFSYIINAAISFITVSLLTHYLSTYDYGIINLYSASLIFLTPFISGGILYPLAVEYFKKSEDDYRRFFTNAMAIPAIAVMFFTLLCVVLQNTLSSFLRIEPLWILIMPIVVWWIMLNEITLLICRNRNQPVRFALFSIGKNLGEILLTILFVIGLNWTWEGRLASAALAPALIGVFSIYLFHRWRLIFRHLDWKLVKHIFWVSLPFIFERLAVFVLGFSDKYFIDKLDLRGTREVGLYGLGSQIASIIYLAILSVHSVYIPYLFKKLKEESRRSIHKSTWLYIISCAGISILLFLFTPLIFQLFIGTEFHDAKKYVYLLIIGYFMWGVYHSFLGYLLYQGKNSVIMVISLLGLVVSIFANIFLIKHWGAIGAAYASIISYSFMALMTVLLAIYILRRSN